MLKRARNRTDSLLMRRVFGGLLFSLGLLASGCASASPEATTAAPSIGSEWAEAQTRTDTSALPFAEEPQAVIVEDSVIGEHPMDDPLDVVYRVLLTEGVRVEIALPDTWRYGMDGRFTDGSSSVQLLVTCDGECGRDWKAHFGFDVDYFDVSNMNDHWVSDPLEGHTPDRFGFGGRGSDSRLMAGRLDAAGNFSGRTAHFREGVSHFVGCEESLVRAASEAQAPEGKICRSVVVDWSSVTESQPDVASGPSTLSTEMRSLVESVEPTTSGQLISLDDDGDLSVAIDLPPGADVRPSVFGYTEVKLAEQVQGFFSKVQLSTSCGTFCEPQDWSKTLNGPGGALSDARAELAAVESDSRIGSGWILSGSTETSFFSYLVVVVTFDDAAGRYLTCRIELEEEDVGLTVELTEMCLSVNPNWIK